MLASLCYDSVMMSFDSAIVHLLLQMLEDDEIDALAIVAVAGISAEGQSYEEVRKGWAGHACPLGKGRVGGV